MKEHFPSSWANELIRPAPLATALFLLALSGVLFAVALFRLAGFFIPTQPLLVLLLLGLPAGALAARARAPSAIAPASNPTSRRALWILLGAALLSAGASLLCRQIAYFPDHLTAPQVRGLFGSLALNALLFFPYFAALGMSGYAGSRLGHEILRGGARAVWGLYFLGAGAGWAAAELALAPLGIIGVMAAGGAGIASALALLSPGRRRLVPAGAAALLLAAALVCVVMGSANPLERGFLHAFKGSARLPAQPGSAEEWSETRFQRWGKYGFCEITRSPQTRVLRGFYNNFLHWEFSPDSGFPVRSLGAVPLWFVPRGGSVAIAGSAGWAAVAYGRELGAGRILVLADEPAVAGALRGPLSQDAERVCEAPGVEVRAAAPRSSLAASDEQFDLIYLVPGGYPPMLFEPGDLLRTEEAYRLYRDRLMPGGVLAIWDSGPRLELMAERHVRALRGLDFEVIAYQASSPQAPGPQTAPQALASPPATASPREILILACPAPDGGRPEPFPRALKALPELKDAPDPSRAFRRILEAFFVAPDGWVPRTARIPALPETAPREIQVYMDPFAAPGTDDDPFPSGNLGRVLSRGQLVALSGWLAAVLLPALAAAAIGALRKAPGAPAGSFAPTAGLLLMAGAGLPLLEHALTLTLWRLHFGYPDASWIAAACTFALAGLGSLALVGRAGRMRAAAGRPLTAFACLVAGAALGSLGAFILPIALGLRVYFVAAGGVLLFAAALAAPFLVRRDRV